MPEYKEYYAGIGSRSTPRDIRDYMTRIAGVLEIKGYILRSGHAEGADLAFEKGVIDPQNKQIFIPWQGFNGSPSSWYDVTQPMIDLARSFHPAWHKCSQGAQKLHARNVCQILGPDLTTLSKFVICWTPGAEMIGGTAQALRIAKHYKIPIYNLGNDQVLHKMLDHLGL